MALHTYVWPHPGHSDCAHVAVRTGIASLAGKAAHRRVAPAEYSRIVFTAVAPRDTCDRGAFSLRLCCSLRGVTAHSDSDRARFAQSCGATKGFAAPS